MFKKKLTLRDDKSLVGIMQLNIIMIYDYRIIN